MTGQPPASQAAAKSARPDQPPAGELPPGQYIPRVWPVLHYGPVPRFRPATWDFRVGGSTEFGADTDGIGRDWPRCRAAGWWRASHCVTKFTIPRIAWEGIAATEVLNAAPPADDVTHVMVPHLYGWKSVKWVRSVEYLTADRRGFWEERGYHYIANPWHEQRFSYQERTGEGPPP